MNYYLSNCEKPFDVFQKQFRKSGKRMLPLSFMVLFILEISLCIGQENVVVIKTDTIYASLSKTTSLLFPSAISLYDIGSEDFGGIKEDNLLLLKAASDQAAPTSLLIKYGEVVYHGTLAFHNNPPQLFIDFSKVAPTDPFPDLIIGKDSTRESGNSLSSVIAEKRLNLLLSDPKGHYKNIAIMDTKERIAFTLSDLGIDGEYVYLKLLFINDSKLKYQVDFVEFVYSDPIESKELKGAYNKKNVYQNASNKVDLIDGKDKRYLGFAIPRYTLSKKGELWIIVHEKNGSRSVKLSLSFQLILDAKTVNN